MKAVLFCALFCAAAASAQQEGASPPVPDFRRFSATGNFGAWALSAADGGGRRWEPAWGVRLGWALNPRVELDLSLARASSAAGTPFVSAAVTHELAVLRAFYAVGSRFALLLGGGAGVALARTRYALLPSTGPDAAVSNLDANAVRSVIEITAAGRARIFRGLEARAEVSALARNGRLELLSLLGLGAAF